MERAMHVGKTGHLRSSLEAPQLWGRPHSLLVSEDPSASRLGIGLLV